MVDVHWYRLAIKGAGARLLLIAFLAVGTLLSPLGRAQSHSGQAMILPVHPVPLVIQTQAGERNFDIEVADDPLKRGRGLMFRTNFPENRGMLFVFETAQEVGFWMKNTPLPLDMLFIDAGGTITSVQQATPYSEAVVSAPGPTKFVLELNAGTAEKNGVNIGDRLHHPMIQPVD